MLCEDEGRVWSDASTSEKRPKWPTNHQKLGERHEQILAFQPASALTLDTQGSEL